MSACGERDADAGDVAATDALLLMLTHARLLAIDKIFVGRSGGARRILQIMGIMVIQLELPQAGAIRKREVSA